MYFLGIDPGKDKCGLALTDSQGKVVLQKIVPALELEEELKDLIKKRELTVIIGDGTTSKKYIEILKGMGNKFVVMPESFSTLEARKLYFEENGYGWQVILPYGLRFPKRPIDDYAARVLVKRYIQKARASTENNDYPKKENPDC